MKVTGKTRIYRKDFDGRPFYSRMISSRKYVDGQKTDDWIRTFQTVQLPKNHELDNKQTIEITDAFESAFEKRNGEIDVKLIVMEYKVVDGASGGGLPDWEEIGDDLPF